MKPLLNPADIGFGFADWNEKRVKTSQQPERRSTSFWFYYHGPLNNESSTLHFPYLGRFCLMF